MATKTNKQLQGEIAELKKQHGDTLDTARALNNELFEAQRKLGLQQGIVRILSKRLIDTQSRLLALKVVHGDLDPANFEQQRQMQERSIEVLLGQLNKHPEEDGETQ